VESASRVADALVRAEILAAARPLRFVHPIVRAAIHDELAPGERASAHARAARLLAERGREPDRVAAHLLLTEPRGDRWVVERLRAAARDAVARGAPEAAAGYVRRVLAEPPPEEVRGQMLLELGSVAMSIGDPAAADWLGHAIDTAPDARTRAAAAERRGHALLAAGRMAEGIGAFERAIDLLGSEDRDAEFRVEALLLAAARTAVVTGDRVLERLDRARALPLDGDGPGERALLGVVSLQEAFENAPARNVAARARRALGGGRLLAETSCEAGIYYVPVIALTLSDALEPAEQELDAAVEDARARGSVQGFHMALSWRALLRQRAGRIPGAEADARRALEIAQEHDLALTQILALAFLADALIERAGLAEAASLLGRTTLPQGAEDIGWFGVVRHARARLRLAQGHAREGLDELLACGRHQERWGAKTPAAIPWRSDAALALASLGEPGEAQRLAAEELALARAFGAPRPLGIALRAAGLVAGGDKGLTLLGEATAVLERAPARLQHARALVDLGSALRRAGQRHAASDPLRRGLDLAHRCGAALLSQRARDELLAAGDRPRQPLLPAWRR
jgi:tetratricopeptide (TPR) repeat protein